MTKGIEKMVPPLHIVLYQPEIPPNTGNIARLCACTGCQLHLVHPLGFDIDDRQLKRAGLDYWDYLDVREHDDWPALCRHLGDETRQWFGFTTRASKDLWESCFAAGDVLVFGPETRGLPEPILKQLTSIRIPMRRGVPVRSLNMASACAIGTYEALRQMEMS
ncbi:MAG TPA: tRNA (cytidine(34)-2'-O)-methyltransferase [Mariprofundaceae bacterium]|nr:tRNA (cytidine(34)-2'-O)-methyltransferase [Mariprofundaceae bacterium]